MGRFVAFGLGAAIAIGVAVVLLLLAALRALQTERVIGGPHFGGLLSWLPYLITVVVAGLVAGLAIRRISAGSRTSAKRNEGPRS